MLCRYLLRPQIFIAFLTDIDTMNQQICSELLNVLVANFFLLNKPLDSVCHQMLMYARLGQFRDTFIVGELVRGFFLTPLMAKLGPEKISIRLTKVVLKFLI